MTNDAQRVLLLAILRAVEMIASAIRAYLGLPARVAQDDSARGH